jgi:hypothetical protein
MKTQSKENIKRYRIIDPEDYEIRYLTRNKFIGTLLKDLPPLINHRFYDYEKAGKFYAAQGPVTIFRRLDNNSIAILVCGIELESIAHEIAGLLQISILSHLYANWAGPEKTAYGLTILTDDNLTYKYSIDVSGYAKVEDALEAADKFRSVMTHHVIDIHEKVADLLGHEVKARTSIPNPNNAARIK